jgi:hypothetical protein
MTGYASRTKVAEGVHDELYVRALALDDGQGGRAVLVTADILGFTPALGRSIHEEARSRYGLPEESLLLAASHTHGGPALADSPSLEIFHGLKGPQAEPVAEFKEWLKKSVLEGIGQALGELVPARLSLAHSSANFGMNRRLQGLDGKYRIAKNPAGLTDSDVPILWVESKDARTLGVVFTYACHCTTLGDQYRYTADYAGLAAARVEAMLGPGAMAFFVAGCGGDVNPNPRGTFELAEAHAQALAEAVIGSSRDEYGHPSPVGGPLRMQSRHLELPLGTLPSREFLDSGLGHPNLYRRRHSEEMLAELRTGRLRSIVHLPIQVWDFGRDLTLVALGGEPCVGYALRIKRELGLEKTWVAGYANEVPCYIPTEEVLEQGGYEPGWDLEFGPAFADGSMLYYGWPAPFAPGIEDRIIDTVHELAGR